MDERLRADLSSLMSKYIDIELKKSDARLKHVNYMNAETYDRFEELSKECRLILNEFPKVFDRYTAFRLQERGDFLV